MGVYGHPLSTVTPATGHVSTISDGVGPVERKWGAWHRLPSANGRAPIAAGASGTVARSIPAVIYLDNNATTRPSDAVIEAVRAALTEFWPNPSSVHRPGQAARHQIELARKEAGVLIGVAPREVVFTSGGTESIDLAIRGVLAAGTQHAARGTQQAPIVVSTRIEHAAVRDLLEQLEKSGEAVVRWAPVDREGIIDLGALPALLEGAALLTLQWANNETGAIQPIEAVGALCRARDVPFHCDGTQWVGKEPVASARQSRGLSEESSTSDTPGQRRTPSSEQRGQRGPAPSHPFDLLTFSPHKFHGPKGIGILWARRGVRLGPALHGTQEQGRRGGTENVPGILGAGVACREAVEWLAKPEERRRMGALRDRFERAVLAGLPEAQINGPPDPSKRLWNTTNIGFPRLEAEALLLMLSERGVCASAGAACSSGSLDPSPVLLAMGVPREVAHGSLRFSLSKETTESEIDEAARIVGECAQRLRGSLALTSSSPAA